MIMMTAEEIKNEIARLTLLVLDDRSTEIERKHAQEALVELRLQEGMF